MDHRTSAGTTRKDDLRGLKALVIGLGVAVVLGTALVIGVAVKRFYAAGTAPAEAAAAASKPAALLRLAAPNGAAISGIASVNGMLAVWIKDGTGGKIVLIDPRGLNVNGTVSLMPQRQNK